MPDGTERAHDAARDATRGMRVDLQLIAGLVTPGGTGARHRLR